MARVKFGSPLPAGTLLRVDKITLDSSPTVGKYTTVVGEVASGPFEGRLVSFQNIADVNWETGVTLMDEEYLELVEGEEVLSK
jgi:hypothetical protein